MVGEEGREPTAQLGLAFLLAKQKIRKLSDFEKNKNQSPTELQEKKILKKRQKDN